MIESIKIKDVEPIRVAYLSYTGKVAEAGKYMPIVFKSIKGKNTGSPFFAISNVNRQTGVADVELCVPTEEMPTAKEVLIKTAPRIKAISLLHIGRYEDMDQSYSKLDLYIKENQLKTSDGCREVYIKGAGLIIKGNPDKYITEILIPLDLGDKDECD